MFSGLASAVSWDPGQVPGTSRDLSLPISAMGGLEGEEPAEAFSLTFCDSLAI